MSAIGLVRLAATTSAKGSVGGKAGKGPKFKISYFQCLMRIFSKVRVSGYIKVNPPEAATPVEQLGKICGI